jgi:hypothetical protein
VLRRREAVAINAWLPYSRSGTWRTESDDIKSNSPQRFHHQGVGFGSSFSLTTLGLSYRMAACGSPAVLGGVQAFGTGCCQVQVVSNSAAWKK